jgi:hypothetical protein
VSQTYGEESLRAAAAAIDDLALPALFSADRFDAYLIATGRDRTRALRLYGWNVAVSCALWSDFAIMEVCLRNAIHACLSDHASRADWWNALTLHPLDAAKINDAAKSIKAKPGHREASASDVVAKQTFGFWTGLLANKYHQRLWAPALNKASRVPSVLATKAAVLDGSAPLAF